MKDFQNRTALITGATGLIGRHLAGELLRAGAKVIAVGRDRYRLNMVFGNLPGESALVCKEGDISVSLPVIDSNIDYIFHAASPISGREIRLNPADTISANIDGARNCLDFLKAQGHGRMIAFSSATVYGNFRLSEDITVSEEMTDRADALHTSNTPYSESKRMVEVLARAYSAQYGVDTVIARMGYVYGFTYPRPETAFYEFIGEALRGEDIVLNNAGMGRRDNIHVDDVVDGLMLVAARGKAGEAYNIASNGELGNYAAVDEIAAMIADTANRCNHSNIRIRIPEMKAVRSPGMKMDNEKLKGLGWNLRVSLRDGIANTLRDYQRTLP